MYQSKRTGPVTTTIAVNPVAGLIISLGIIAIGGGTVATLTPGGILAGTVVIWCGVCLFRGSLHQIRRAIDVWRS